VNEDELAAKLIAEQFQHVIDLMKSEQRMIEERLIRLEKASEDHEQRLRQLTDSATQFKVLAGLSTGGGLLSLIALARAILGN